jgi:hypothetical protein
MPSVLAKKKASNGNKFLWVLRNVTGKGVQQSTIIGNAAIRVCEKWEQRHLILVEVFERMFGNGVQPEASLPSARARNAGNVSWL